MDFDTAKDVFLYLSSVAHERQELPHEVIEREAQLMPNNRDYFEKLGALYADALTFLATLAKKAGQEA